MTMSPDASDRESLGRLRYRGLRWRNAAALALGAAGCLQMIGYVSGSRTLRGIGAATVVSPLPKVFSDVDGLETFASTFTLRYAHADGTTRELRITPAVYGRLAGPYNRRNVYGAALSYAPRLPRDLWEPVYCYGLAAQGPLRRELGLADEDHDFMVTIRTETRGRHDVWTLVAKCKA
jgi:hypothetical protein